MTIKQEILQKAIEKAVRNGYQGWASKTAYLHTTDWRFVFDKDFAKAFWPDSDIKITLPEVIYSTYRTPVIKRSSHTETKHKTSWKRHLQQMVLSESPIKYLEAYL